MKYGTVKNVGKPVSRLVMGMASLPGNDMEEKFCLLDEVFALGINTFDTAAIYRNDSEECLIKWIADRGIRDQVVLLTKGAHPNKWRKRVTPYDILSDVSDSLAKPGADYIDIFMLHRDDPDVPVEPIIDILNRLYEAGKIRSFGCSNWTAERVQRANEYAQKFGMLGFSSVSPNYGLAVQVNDPWRGGCVSLTGDSAEEERRYYRENQMPIFAYSSLGRGFFSGKFRSDEQEKAKTFLDRPALVGYFSENNFERLKRVELLAEKIHAKVPQIALAWTLQSGLNVFPIVSAKTGERMKENIRALDVKITPDEAAWLNLEKDEI